MSSRIGNSETADSADSSQQDDSGGKTSKQGSGGGGGGGKKTPGGKIAKSQFCSLANNMMPSFYIGGGNGVSLVEAPLLALGWKRTADKYDERFRLKWVECKSKINYAAFKEGDQLVNHISNCQLITNKLGLLNSLQEYERVTLSTKGRPPRLRMAEFVPETYRLDCPADRESFLQVYQDGETWICKPTGMNQGKGIYLLRSREEIDKLLSEREAKKEQCKPSRPLMSRIVQRYIHNPLLLDERKFDIRAYMLIANTMPYLVLYHKGYVRLSCFKYNREDTDLTTHLTNQYIQKKAPQYSELKEDTAWSMDKFNKYINEKVASDKGIEKDWVYNSLTKQMQRIMLHCFNSVKHKLHCKVGYFDLYGFDFMIDQNMKIWLIEININPCLATNCEALKEVIPAMVEETLHISIECFEKSRKCQALMPLNSLKTFSTLYCGSNPAAVAPRHSRSVSPERVRPTQPSIPRQGRSPGRVGPRSTTSSTQLAAGSPYQTKQADIVAAANSQRRNRALLTANSSHGSPTEVKLPSLGGVSLNARTSGTNARPVGSSNSAPNKNSSATAKSQNGSLGSTTSATPVRKSGEGAVTDAVTSARKNDGDTSARKTENATGNSVAAAKKNVGPVSISVTPAKKSEAVIASSAKKNDSGTLNSGPSAKKSENGTQNSTVLAKKVEGWTSNSAAKKSDGVISARKAESSSQNSVTPAKRAEGGSTINNVSSARKSENSSSNAITLTRKADSFTSANANKKPGATNAKSKAERSSNQNNSNSQTKSAKLVSKDDLSSKNVEKGGENRENKSTPESVDKNVVNDPQAKSVKNTDEKLQCDEDEEGIENGDLSLANFDSERVKNDTDCTPEGVENSTKSRDGLNQKGVENKTKSSSESSSKNIKNKKASQNSTVSEKVKIDDQSQDETTSKINEKSPKSRKERNSISSRAGNEQRKESVTLTLEEKMNFVEVDEKQNNFLQNNRMMTASSARDSIYTLPQTDPSLAASANSEVKLKMTHVKKKVRESSGS